MQEVDWRVGEEIAIASTGWNHLESERRTITAVSADRRTLSFVEELRFRHYSAIETYGTSQFPMRAEGNLTVYRNLLPLQVALLTRNIVIQGDSNSEQT